MKAADPIAHLALIPSGPSGEPVLYDRPSANPRAPMRIVLARIVLATTGAVVLLYSAGIESSNLGLVPDFVYLAAISTVLAGIVLGRCTLRRMAAAVAVLALALALASAGMSSLAHRLHRVKSGMTVQEARLAMSGFQEGSGWTNPFTGGEFVADGAIIFREPDAGPGDSTWGVVQVRNGRVVGVHLSPD